MALASPATLRIAALVALLSLTAIVVQLALRERTPPVRCPDGLVLTGGRCCGLGQTRSQGRCVGRARACGPAQEQVSGEAGKEACVLRPRRLAVAGGELPVGAADWQRANSNQAIRVASFLMDQGEVTLFRYLECVQRGSCEKPKTTRDLGAPVTGISPAQAEAFCRFAGGRLPTSAEWRLAASGTVGRRFPWGHTGLVCRRSAFGLTEGPCSSADDGPELAGSRPPGATPEGILDLSGNVAEWTRDPDGRYRARGGSYRSRVAAELVTAALETPAQDANHVGFRCVY